MVAPTSLVSQPIIYFDPSHWSEHFLNFAPLDEKAQITKEQDLKKLKEEVKNDLLATAEKPLEQLNIIDAIERLGVGYHFEKEIEEGLKQMYENYNDQCCRDDLHHVSTRFRILRQHGYYVPCDVFEKFKNDDGGLKECILDDIWGILSLYEATHVRTHGDEVLDEAFAFTTTHLKLMVDKINPHIAEIVAHALHQSIHKGFVRLESKHYIYFYEREESHNRTLLKFAKLDFNLLQVLHRQELRDIFGWWKELYSKAPFTRDRIVEAYFWVLGVYYEPGYLRARRILMKIFMITQVFDDIFDAYGTNETLELFAEAVHRWDQSYVSKLPQYFNSCFQELIDIIDEDEKELAKEGREFGVYHYKQQFDRACQSWLREAQWRDQKYIPKYEEYMKVAIISIGQIQGIIGSFLGMEPVGTEEDYEWVCQNPMPKIVEACLVILRLMNDVGSTKYEQSTRDHVASSVQCLVKETGDYNEEHVYQLLEAKVENAWKDLNQGMLRPYSIPKPLLDRILNLARAPDIFYKGRSDGYTNVNQVIKDKVAAVLFEPITL